MKKKPTDHEILTALNEIIQESNKPKKVELANIKELDKFVKALKEATKKIKSNRKKLGKAIKDIQGQRKEVERQYNTAIENKKAVDLAIKNSETLSKKIVKQAKDLGISPSEIPNVRELVDLIEQVEGTQETIDLFINTAKGIVNAAALK
jgi:ABC-type nitrate/sulfonate/bicarbonate transport system substrate-binding protein